MNWKRPLLAIAGVLVLGIGVIGIAPDAVFATDAQVEVITSGGILTATAVDLDLGIYQFSIADQTTPNANMVIEVADARGTGAGWHVTVSSTDFDATGAGQDIPVTGFKYAGAGSVALISGQVISIIGGPLVSPALNGTSLGTVATIGTASLLFGSGSYTYTFPVNLQIPGGTLIDVYHATVSVTAVSGP